MSIVMGVDQSLSCTGVFWVGDGIKGSSAIVPPAKLRDAPRLVYIKNQLRALLDEYKPSLVLMEGYAFAAPGRVFQLGELGGVIKVLLEEQGIHVVSVAPVQLKKFITGNAKAEKLEVVDAVNRELGLALTLKDNDVADAAALALIGRAIQEPATTYPRYQLEVIHALTVATKAKKARVKRKQKFPNM